MKIPLLAMRRNTTAITPFDRFCTYQKLIEKQETKIANKYWRILDMAWE